LGFGGKYQELEKEAQEKFGLSSERSKPLIARYVAERIPVQGGSEMETKFKALAASLNSLKG
jgi:hypothetical protein